MNLKFTISLLLIWCCCKNDAFVMPLKCPTSLCNCAEEIPHCIARNTSEILIIGNANFRQLNLTLDSSLANLNLGPKKWPPHLSKLYLNSRTDKEFILNFIRLSPNLDFISLIGNCSDWDFVSNIFRQSNITYLALRGRIECLYQRTDNVDITCNASCFQIGGSFSEKQCVCIVKMANDKIQTAWNATVANGTMGIASFANETNMTREPLQKIEMPRRYHESFKFSLILGGLSVVALILNCVILAKMCRCQAQSVSKIFGMSMMLFNIFLAEYGIALSVYLTQEEGVWNRSFCQVMTATKLFNMAAVLFALLCLTFQWSINPPDDNYNKQDIRFKAIVYILEGFVLAGMICVLAWTKFDNWGYLCDIYRPVIAAEKIIVVVEYCYHCLIFLLALRFPYKTLRRKEPAQSYIKMKYVVEREHPIFVIVFTTFLFWSVPFFVTIPATGLGNVYLTPLIRNCALMAGAVVLPLLFVIRNTRICCSRHTACGVNDPRVCQCKGRSSEMCYACEVQHKDMISNCEFHSFGDRRKSLSLDDLKYVLGVYQKHNFCSMKIKKKKLISRSFPIINMDTIEEADVEDINDIDRLFIGGNTKNFELSIESPVKHLGMLSRENTTSMPNLCSPKKVPTARKKRVLQAKLSLSPNKSALLSPVKRSLTKKRAASLDNRLLDKNADNSASDRSTTSSPTKSDNEINSLLPGEKSSSKTTKKKRKSLSKSKESIKSRNSTNSKDSSKKTKNKLEIEAVNTDSSGPASPNRVSRIPSFIPLTDAGSSDSIKRKKSSSSIKSSPAKTKAGIKAKCSPSKLLKTEDEELLGEDPNRVPSRGPTFILVGEEDELSDEAVEQPLLITEKKSKRGIKRQRKAGCSREATPLHEVDGTHGSRKSLEWDPSYSLSDSSCSSPVDEFVPPQPPPPPSNYALERVKEMGVRQPDSPHVSIGRGSSYSMDWDPTSIQIRHSLVSPCEWEPYSVDEARSTPTSPDVMVAKAIAETNNNSNTSDGDSNNTKAPLATADV